MAYLVRGTEDQLKCSLSAILEGDFPTGPRNTWAYREPLDSVEAGRETLTCLQIT